MIRKTLLLAALLTVVSCTSRIVDFTILSTKNIDLKRISDFQVGSGRTEGQDTKYIIIIIPTGVPSVKEAVDLAIEAVPGAVALIDGVVTHKWFYIPYLVGSSSYIVEGTPLIDPLLAQNSELQSNYLIAYNDEDGEGLITINITEEEYLNTLATGEINMKL